MPGSPQQGGSGAAGRGPAATRRAPGAVSRRAARAQPLAPSRARAGQSELSVARVGLSLPNMPAERAQRVASRALELVAQRLPPGLSGNVGALRVKLELPSAPMSEQALSEALCRAILRALPAPSASPSDRSQLLAGRTSHG